MAFVVKTVNILVRIFTKKENNMDDIRLLEFHSEPNSGFYKGYKQQGAIKTKPGFAKITFSDGQNEFEILGNTIENAFDHIDILTS